MRENEITVNGRTVNADWMLNRLAERGLGYAYVREVGGDASVSSIAAAYREATQHA
jgi:hypothetical protein